MTERRALIGFGIAAVLAQVVVINGLALLGADSEMQARASVLLMGAAGLGGGFLFMRYH
jgi:hypothetical protein